MANLNGSINMREEVVIFFIRQVRDSAEVLLGQKSSSAKVAEGRWNGYGGGIEEGETPRQAGVRETDEETNHGIVVLEENLEPMGSVIFHNPSGKGDRRVHFFTCRTFTGEAKETEEMIKPTWYDPKDEGTLEKMMPADRLFVPQMILEGKRVKEGWVRFGEGYRLDDSHFEFEDD